MENKMKEYAELLVRAGANVQRGQELFIFSSVESADLARLCTEEAYAAGAREVTVVWNDDAVSRMKYLKADPAVFDEMPPWLAAMYDYQCDVNAAKLVIYGSDPELLKGVEPAKIQRWQQTTGKRLERYTTAQTANEFQWCIGAYATKSWAKKVFPQFEVEEAVSSLWDAIYSAVRVEGDGGAADRWEKFVTSMKRRIGILNEYNFRYLKYRSELGTDLMVELPRGHYWSGASERAKNGVEFIANIPSEEIFTLPKKDGVNGTIVASKPLPLSGNIVDGIRMTLKDGKIVEALADVGQEFLKKALETDEGAPYLGEVALVPFNSPISNSGILFYNVLFDENASCHFAFGEAYPLIHGAASKSKDEKLALGINQSFVHEDFMVGTADMSITGITGEGKEVPVFTDGNFAF